MFTENSKLKMVNTTIAGNSSAGNGGGICNATGYGDVDTIHVHNTVISGNYSLGSLSYPDADNLNNTINNPYAAPGMEHLITNSLIKGLTYTDGGSYGNNIDGAIDPNFIAKVPDEFQHFDLLADYRIKRNSILIGKGHNRVPEAIGYIDRTCEDSFGETLPYVLHAEVNAISNAKRRSEGVIYNMFCTHNPCMNCVAHILEYERIRNFIFITRNYNPKYEAALQLLLRVNCNVYSFEDFSDKLTKYELVKG